MRSNILVNISLALAILGLLSFVILISYCLNKGFELSDESYYLLATKYPLDTLLLNTSFGLINHRLSFGFNDLLSLRVFKLIYQLSFLLVFARAFFLFATRSLNAERQASLLLSTVLVIAGLSNYDYLPMTLSYNSWSLNFGLLFWAGVLFAHTTRSNRGLAFSNMLMGLSVLFLFYTKAPNAVVMGLIYIMYVLIYQRKNILNSLLLFALGKIAGIIILFFSYDAFVNTTSNLFHNILNTGHTDPGNYFGQIGDLLTVHLGFWFFFIQALVFGSMIIIRKKQMSPLVGLMIIGLNSYFSIRYGKGNSFGIANEFICFVVFALNSLAAALLFYKKGKNHWFFTLSLILTPFLLAAGTSNPIFYTASQLAVFAVSGLFLMLLKADSEQMRYYYAYAMLFITLFIGSFLYHGMLLQPYRQDNLSAKLSELPYSKQINKIFESESRIEKYKELADKLNRTNTERMPVLASPPVLGSLMLTEMDPFAVCWIADPDDNASANDEYFTRSDVRHKKPFLFIAQQLRNGIEQNKVFKKHGMDLRTDYIVKDSVYLEWNKEYYYLMQPVKNS